MKNFIIGLVCLCALFSARAAQPRVVGVEVVQANGGSVTNLRTTGTNSLYGTDPNYHALNAHNAELAGNIWYNFSFGDGSSYASNRWRIGVNSIGWSIYDMGTGRVPFSIATAESSVGGSGMVDVNGVLVSSNGAISSHSTTFLGGDTTVSNSLSLTGKASSINFDVRGLLGSSSYRQRFNFSNDMGQTYSWQVNVSTNQYSIQRQNTDADMPLIITRSGMKIGSLNATVTNAGSFLVAGPIAFAPTNSNLAAFSVANSNALPATNFLGVIEMAAAATLFHDASVASEWSITNRIGAATVIVITNTVAGQTLAGTVIGEVSGGTSRQVTIQPDLGHLVASLDEPTTNLATAFVFTLTNGFAVEWNDQPRKLNGTNVHKFVTRQFKF